MKEFYYTWFGGIRKNSKILYWMRALLIYLTPKCFCRWYARRILSSFNTLTVEEQRYVMDRVNYMVPQQQVDKSEYRFTLADNNFFSRRDVQYDGILANQRGRMAGPTMYAVDTYEYTRCFPQSMLWSVCGGDVNTDQDKPTISKSRPAGSCNNVLLNLDHLRHFLFFRDPFVWEQKQSLVLFRGVVGDKRNRQVFMKMWQNNPMCDLSDTSSMTLYQHLRYRYIMALEGYDVASNLKWVMSSNSIAVMPRPTCESWFMELRLVPDYHYICIDDDYHNLIEKITYYENNPNEAKAIVQHAHEWVEQFQNRKREQMISLMVMDKYLNMVNA